MKWILIILGVSLLLNIAGGWLIFRPKPPVKPQYIYITNQNYLPAVEIPINYEHQPGDVSVYEYLSELNKYRTNSFTITNFSEGFARVKLVARYCDIPLPKTQIYKTPENIVAVGVAMPYSVMVNYAHLITSFMNISIYGGIGIGLAGSNSIILGGSIYTIF